MHNADAQCMPEEREKVQRTEKKKRKKEKKKTSAISCLALKYEFYFTL